MSNRKSVLEQKQKRWSMLSRRLLLQYIFALLTYAAVLVVTVFICYVICLRISWDTQSLVYKALTFIQDYIIAFAGGVFLIGWTIITYFYISKPLRYLDELVLAAQRLSRPTEEPILLPVEMSGVQNELNLTREKALRDALAAKAAEQQKNDLIVYLAHDLKTPLTSVIGYLSLLRDEPQISPELRSKYTGIALDKAQRLEDLINEFFDITRFNLTQLTLEEETVNLTRMLEQITFEFNPLLAERELSWDLRLQAGIELACDPGKLQRVFDNLLRNAVNYSYPKTDILVSLERRGDLAVILVKNHGKTIPAEKLDRIFEQFFRLDASRASSTGGAGLGLAIAKEIVELHGGAIKAESADESVVFTVALPLRRKKIV